MNKWILSVSFSVLAFVLAACAGTQRQSEVKSLQERVASLEQALEAEKIYNQKLMTELQLLRPPATGEIIPISELVGVPERYLQKTVLTEGRLASGVSRHSIASGFLLVAPNNIHVGLLCAYKNANLDEISRRLLLAKQNKSLVRIEGQLLPLAIQGLTKQVGMSDQSGYEFIVSRVLE